MNFVLKLFLWTLFWMNSTAKILPDPLLSSNDDIREIRVIEKPMKRDPMRFTSEQKEAILNLHNEYRKTAEPPAADMRMLSWDSTVERSAQLWAENCVFEYGMPSGYRYMGQNLYVGPDKEGLRATFLWWNETHDYHFWNDSCTENIFCSTYTQMMWATIERLGCAVHACAYWNLIVCHYDPWEIVSDVAPYQVGKACSQCKTDNAGKCFEGLCVSNQECQKQGMRCTCPLTCHNCGELDETTCHCKCKDGWDSLDCSRKCEDAHEFCRKNPGFPNEDSCTRDIRIRQNLCRSMCHQCNESIGNSSTNVCMSGEICSTGYVLDSTSGECKLLCPGPKCSGIQTPMPSRIGIGIAIGSIFLLTLLL